MIGCAVPRVQREGAVAICLPEGNFLAVDGDLFHVPEFGKGVQFHLDVALRNGALALKRALCGEKRQDIGVLPFVEVPFVFARAEGALLIGDRLAVILVEIAAVQALPIGIAVEYELIPLLLFGVFRLICKRNDGTETHEERHLLEAVLFPDRPATRVDLAVEHIQPSACGKVDGVVIALIEHPALQLAACLAVRLEVVDAHIVRLPALDGL